MLVKFSCKPFRLWLVCTLVLVIAVGLMMRPDRDAAQYLKYQHIENDAPSIQTRQFLTNIRLLRNEGFSLNQIEDQLLNSNSFDAETIANIMELQMSLDTRTEMVKRLKRFAALVLVPPFIILELGAVCVWTRRGLRAWRTKPRLTPKHT